MSLSSFKSGNIFIIVRLISYIALFVLLIFYKIKVIRTILLLIIGINCVQSYWGFFVRLENFHFIYLILLVYAIFFTVVFLYLLFSKEVKDYFNKK